MVITCASRGKIFSIKEVVHVRVGVRGGVSKDDDLIVAVVCVAKGREHHAARGDPGEDQGGDVAVPQLSVEVSGGKSADASLADNDSMVGRMSVTGCCLFRWALWGHGLERSTCVRRWAHPATRHGGMDR
jgi:hypothetical protein